MVRSHEDAPNSIAERVSSSYAFDLNYFLSTLLVEESSTSGLLMDAFFFLSSQTFHKEVLEEGRFRMRSYQARHRRGSFCMLDFTTSKRDCDGAGVKSERASRLHQYGKSSSM